MKILEISLYIFKILYFCQIGFSASDAVSGLKLVEAGVPREDLALLAVPLAPVQIILPVVSTKHYNNNMICILSDFENTEI